MCVFIANNKYEVEVGKQSSNFDQNILTNFGTIAELSKTSSILCDAHEQMVGVLRD